MASSLQRPARLPSHVRPPHSSPNSAVTPSEKLQVIRGHNFKSCSNKSSRSSQPAASRHLPGTRVPALWPWDRCTPVSAPACGYMRQELYSHCASSVPSVSEQEPRAPSSEQNPEGMGPLSGSEPLYVTPSLRSPHTELTSLRQAPSGHLRGSAVAEGETRSPCWGQSWQWGMEGGRRAHPATAWGRASSSSTGGDTGPSPFSKPPDVSSRSAARLPQVTRQKCWVVYFSPLPQCLKPGLGNCQCVEVRVSLFYAAEVIASSSPVLC